MRIARLTCAVRQGGERSPLRVAAFDGNGWTKLERVAGTSITTPPALVRFGAKLYALHQDPGTSGNLMAVTFEAGAWSTEQTLATGVMSCSPAPVVSGGTLYVFGQGFGASGQLAAETTTDGVSWIKLSPIWEAHVALSPAAVLFRGSIHVLYCGGRELKPDGTLRYVTLTGTTWSRETPVPGVTLGAFPPTAAVFQQRLHVIYQGGGAQLSFATFDGTRWEAGEGIAPTKGNAPGGASAVVYEETLYVVYRSSSLIAPNRLSYVAFDGEAWRGPMQAGSIVTPNEPVVTVY